MLSASLSIHLLVYRKCEYIVRIFIHFKSTLESQISICRSIINQNLRKTEYHVISLSSHNLMITRSYYSFFTCFYLLLMSVPAHILSRFPTWLVICIRAVHGNCPYPASWPPSILLWATLLTCCDKPQSR